MIKDRASREEKIAVLLPVYYKDSPDYFYESFNSITYIQSLKPDEVFVFCDGPIDKKIDVFLSEQVKISNSWKLRIVRYKNNRGLGVVLKNALQTIDCDYIVRMDADDIAHKDRVLLLKRKLDEGYDIVGSNMREFNEFGTFTSKEVPEKNDTIRNKLLFRNSINHPSVAFRRSIIAGVGGYRDMPGFEDYDLWIRCAKNIEVKFFNIQRELVSFRITPEYWLRRRGWAYMQKEIRFAAVRLTENNLTLLGFIYVVLRSIVFRNSPIFVFKFINKKYLRNESKCF